VDKPPNRLWIRLLIRHDLLPRRCRRNWSAASYRILAGPPLTARRPTCPLDMTSAKLQSIGGMPDHAHEPRVRLRTGLQTPSGASSGDLSAVEWLDPAWAQPAHRRGSRAAPTALGARLLRIAEGESYFFPIQPMLRTLPLVVGVVTAQTADRFSTWPKVCWHRGLRLSF
jgi:hypothetical protein